MEYIVLDIEFNGRKFASELPMEVIEIGAVRLDASLRNTGEFTAFVKPVYFARLNSFIKEKTGITQEEIDAAQGFSTVISDFMEWLNESESLLFVTWGGEDMKRIVFDTRMHQLDDTYWMTVPAYNLLKGYLKVTNQKNDVSVETALQELQIPPAGSAHRALDDARMTAEIFKSIFRKLDLKEAKPYQDTYSNAKERRMVKQAIRAMRVQKLAPDWDVLVQKFLADKLSLDDPRKVAELQNLFQTEIAEKSPAKTSR